MEVKSTICQFVGSIAEKVKAPFFTATMRLRSRDLGSTFTLVGRVVASSKKALHDNSLYLVAKSKKRPENLEIGNS